MDYQLLQSIESVIITNLLAYRQLLLPNVCILAINRYGASLTPDGNTLIPPQDHLEIYHPEAFCEVNLRDLMANEFTGGDMYEAEQLYWQYIAVAAPDGVTLTVNSLAIVDISLLEVLAVSPELQMQLNPEVPQYIAPLAPPVRTSNRNSVDNGKQQRQSETRNGQTKIVLSSIVLASAALYVAYFFLLR